MHRIMVFCSALAVAFVLSSLACAQHYGVTLISNCTGLSYATGINSHGAVVGYCTNGGTAQRALLWTKTGGARNLGTLGGDIANANGLNDAGSVVGYSYLPGDIVYHAFLWTPTSGMQDLGTLGGASSSAHGINNLGQVVGDSLTADGSTHAFVWSQSTGMQDLGTLPSFATCFGLAINDAGKAVGTCYAVPGNSSPSRGFLWTATTGIHDLGTLGGPTSSAVGISAHGEIVGTAETPDNHFHAYYWTGSGGMTEIVTPGTDSEGGGISDNGQVVGSFFPTILAFSWTAAGGVKEVNSEVNHIYGVYGPIGVNNSGQIAAYGTLNSVCCNAMFLAPMQTTTLRMGNAGRGGYPVRP